MIDYEARKKAVLAAAINRYIQDAIPVASQDVAEEFNLSPATIRNIFAELEDMGYLTHPHTSGGRVPTNKGYRYYVDFLTQGQLLDEEKRSIMMEYKREIQRLEDVLEKASEIISHITHYTGIASFVEWHDRFYYKGMDFILAHPEFWDLETMRLLIRMVEEKQRLLDIINRDFNERVKIYIGEELGEPKMSNCSLVVCSYRVNNKPMGKLAVLGPVRMEYQHVIPAMEYISDVVTEVLNNI
jgi:transcriptional regulator of heat shock response